MSQKVKHQPLLVYIAAVATAGAAVIALPIKAKVFHTGPSYLDPPLGPLDQFVVPFSVVVVAVCALLPWLLRLRSWAVIGAVTSGVLCLFSFGGYVVCVSDYIVRIDAANKTFLVSIGSQRTPWARTTFGDKSNLEMLKERGHAEEDIHLLWTDASILRARALTLGSFLGIGGAFLFFVGSTVRVNALRDPNGPHGS